MGRRPVPASTPEWLAAAAQGRFWPMHDRLFAQGGELDLPPAAGPPVITAVVLRNVVAPLLFLGLSSLIVDVPDAYLLAAAMPCGLNALTAAHGYGLDEGIVSSAIAWSTTFVLLGAALAGVLT